MMEAGFWPFSVGARSPTKDVPALPASYELESSESPASLNLLGSVIVNFTSFSTMGLSEGGGG